jgi:hypothetical protein
MAALPSAPVPPPALFSATVRNLVIPACTLTADDLRKLYGLLEKKAREAADYQVAALQRLEGQTNEQFEEVKQKIRSSFDLVVQVRGSRGEGTGSRTGEALLEGSLPDSIMSVQYDSAFMFRSQFNLLEPQNSVRVYLDFGRTEILDMLAQPAANNSSGLISGTNSTWVNGTHEELEKFFEERSTARGWLYSRHSYDVAVLLVGIPASFALIYRVDHWLRPVIQVSNALFVALYVYLVVIELYGFRVLFNYAKWVFPKCEGPTRRQGGPRFHKSIFGLIGGTFLSVVVETILRMLGFRFP